MGGVGNACGTLQNISPAITPMPVTSRRTFIKAGLIGATTLAVAGGLVRLRQHTPPQRFLLDPAASAALAAITGAILQGALPATAADAAAAIAATVARVQATINGLPLATQKEIADLFGLLTLAPTRRFLAGMKSDWPNAQPAQVAAFLQSWRTHRFALMQSAYQALHDLVFGAWYSDDASWRTIGYPGPRVHFA
jgi:hypothetical protein